MLLDITLGTNDLERAARFYDGIFSELGCPRFPNGPARWIGWRVAAASDGVICLWLCAPFDGAPATTGNGSMITFRARNAAQVRAFHRAGLAHGGTDDGAPGTRARYAPDFYVAYLRDPDGHKIACADDRHVPEAES